LCVFYLAVWLGLDAVAAVFESGSEVSLWYPPTGLTVALLLTFGLRFTPVLLLTDVLHGLLVTDPRVGWLSVELRSVVSIAVYAGTVWLLLRVVRIDPRLPTQRDVTWFLGLACLAGPVLVAVVQVAQYDQAGLLRWRDLPVDVFGFWSGSATGVGVLAPALLVAARRWPSLWPGRPPVPLPPVRSGIWRERGELAGQTGLLVVTVYLAFGPPADGRLDLTALVYVPLLWVAVRCGLSRTVAAVLLINVLVVALVGTAAQDHPLRLQLGLMTMTLAGLALGALAAQRRADLEAARHAAVHDPLTGLANRVLLTDRIVAAVHRHQRDPAALPRCCTATSTGSKASTTASGTPPATSCSSRSPAAWSTPCAPETSSVAWAAMSSWCCWTGSTQRNCRWSRTGPSRRCASPTRSLAGRSPSPPASESRRSSPAPTDTGCPLSRRRRRCCEPATPLCSRANGAAATRSSCSAHRWPPTRGTGWSCTPRCAGHWPAGSSPSPTSPSSACPTCA